MKDRHHDHAIMECPPVPYSWATHPMTSRRGAALAWSPTSDLGCNTRDYGSDDFWSIAGQQAVGA
jgi:hypothetical protein